MLTNVSLIALGHGRDEAVGVSVASCTFQFLLTGRGETKSDVSSDVGVEKDGFLSDDTHCTA